MSGVAVPGNLDAFYERLERVEANPTKMPKEAAEVSEPKATFYKKKKPTIWAWLLTISILLTLVFSFAYAMLPDWVLDMVFDYFGYY